MREIYKTVQECRLKWDWPVLRREEEYVGKRVMVMEVQWRINNGAIGARAPGPRAPGGPKFSVKTL